MKLKEEHWKKLERGERIMVEKKELRGRLEKERLHEKTVGNILTEEYRRRNPKSERVIDVIFQDNKVVLLKRRNRGGAQ